MVDNAPSVGILSCSKNAVDARDKNIQQRAKSLSLAGAFGKKLVGFARFLTDSLKSSQDIEKFVEEALDGLFFGLNLKLQN